MSASAAGALTLEGLSLGYDRQPAVRGLNLRVPAGDLLAVVGPNGAGKSTLLKGIMGLLRPLSGRVRLDGLRRREIAYLPQQAELDRRFPIAVGDLVLTGLWHRLGLFGRADRGLRRRVPEALAAVGLEGFERRPIGALSGGQLQRVLFARLLLQDARVLLLDEPFTAVDARTARDLLAIVRRWHGDGRTVIAVLHDLDLVRDTFPTAALLARELVAAGPTAEVLRAENLFRARHLCEAHEDVPGVWLDRAA